LKVYRTGYHINDVYDDYLQMGLPATIGRAQMKTLQERNDGRPVEIVRLQIRAGQPFVRDFSMRENDVYLITLER
jgi:xylan 1,4-beta-xylosidase